MTDLHGDTLRVVFFGTAPFGFPVMHSLKTHPNVDFLGVVSQPDREKGRGQSVQSPPVAEFARELGVDLYQPENVNDGGLDLLQTVEPVDLGIVIAYGQFLEKSVFEFPTHGVFNFHASLLPRWRGAAPIRHTLLAGDSKTGVTVFKIQEGMDSGPVSERLITMVREKETYGQLYERLSQLNVGGLNILLSDLLEDTITLSEQSEEATFADRIQSGDARIDWSQPANRIDNHVRAFCPNPGAFTRLNGKRMKIYATEIESESSDSKAPGTILSLQQDRIIVEAGSGTIAVKELQPAGSKRMGTQSYLAGQPDISSGDRFE